MMHAELIEKGKKVASGGKYLGDCIDDMTRDELIATIGLLHLYYDMLLETSRGDSEFWCDIAGSRRR